jgi:hypothetical protein
VSPASPTAVLLVALTAVFAARVVGQALVAFLGVGWLPPMEAWYSELLPYAVLLPIQLLLLAVQVVIDRDVWRGRGFSAAARPRAGTTLQWLAGTYALAMLTRLVLTGTHLIPIVFHWVLAAYLLTLGRNCARQPTPAPAASGG